MTRIVFSLFLTTGLMISPGIRAQKFAHFSYDSLLNVMPELARANDAAAAFYKSLESQLLSMQQSLDSKISEYDEGKRKGTLTPAILQLKESEIQSLQERIQNFQMSAQGDFEREKNRLLKPIRDKVNRAVSEIAREKGYKYIFDSSAENTLLLFADPAEDIFALMKSKVTQ